MTFVAEELGFLVGEWEMELSNAGFLPERDVMRGTATFELVEEGRFLVQRQGDAATWMIGRDDGEEAFIVLYSDARGIDRVYSMSLEDGVWKVWRDDPDFSQRFEARVADDRARIDGEWQKRHGDAAWEHDFDVVYRRIGRR